MENDLIPLGQLRPAGNNASTLAVTDRKKGDILPQVMGVKGMVARPTGGSVLHVKRREIVIDEQSHQVDPQDIMTIIRSLTQEIGDWKKMDSIMGCYKVSALRTARQAAVSDLKKFGIHWQIDKATGESIFWM